MADPPRYPDRGNDTGVESEPGSTRSSLWTKVLIVVFAVLFVVVIILHLLTGGGPGNH
jgi:hypothetical protein